MADKSSQALERQIAEIHRLLEKLDAKVTWDDRIADPDNPKQLRQIDITISRGDRLTLVECRAWQVPQDANWVEHLDGRRRGYERRLYYRSIKFGLEAPRHDWGYGCGACPACELRAKGFDEWQGLGTESRRQGG